MKSLGAVSGGLKNVPRFFLKQKANDMGAKETINFIHTEEIETAMPGLIVEVRYSALAEITGDDVEILPGLSVSVNGDRWTDYLVPSGKTNDERKFLAMLREAARLAKWQRDNVELPDNSFANSIGKQ